MSHMKPYTIDLIVSCMLFPTPAECCQKQSLNYTNISKVIWTTQCVAEHKKDGLIWRNSPHLIRAVDRANIYLDIQIHVHVFCGNLVVNTTVFAITLFFSDVSHKHMFVTSLLKPRDYQVSLQLYHCCVDVYDREFKCHVYNPHLSCLANSICAHFTIFNSSLNDVIMPE